ncbi:F0F1 ATP synthase subunit B [Propionicicella superfundia]|uniref:F0F1 ATP synthase subunit B n=1 Tax=Propionicicella superfundia TaxID=348582 RepID=UPI0003FA7329|nr:F0F1 ATP synthase subunit B [Propionicicella superfundia]
MVPFEIDFGPLVPEHLSEIIVGIVLFLLVWAVMAWKVVPAFEKTYAERTAAIQGGIERAEAKQREAQDALDRYNAQLAGAREEAARIREDAKNQGSQIVAEMREQGTVDATRLREAAAAQITAERTQAVTELKNEIGGLATQLAGQIVGESLTDDERAKRSVDRFISELEGQTGRA